MSTEKNRIILGCMTFGPDPEKGARVTSLDEYKKCLSYLEDHEYLELDTARSYISGLQEGFTAQAGWKGRFKIATKHYPAPGNGHTPEVLRERLGESLSELGTDKVDIFYLHAPDRNTPFVETLRATNELHKEGKFTTLALSNYTAAEVAEICLICHYHGWVRPTLYQAMYNAVTRMIEPELVVVLRRFGLDLVIYNPIAGGLLSGKYKSSDGIPQDGRFSDVSAAGKVYRGRYFKDTSFQALAIIEDAIQPHGLSMIETALRWCVHHSCLNLKSKGGNDGIIIGVSSFQQLQDNISYLEKGPLPEDVVKALDDAWAVVKGNAPNYWHLENKYGYDTVKAVYGDKI